VKAAASSHSAETQGFPGQYHRQKLGIILIIDE
jgi:hypothetical protein